MPQHEKRSKSKSHRKSDMSNAPFLTLGFIVLIAVLAAMFFIVTGGSN
jgi:hypothetical protein